MNPSRLFIERPVATTLLMIAIFLSGVVAYKVLPISALPQVDYPTIQVTTLYPGASPDVMTSAITAPLERQFGQMPGLAQMLSSSSGGASVITLKFALDLDLDVGLDVDLWSSTRNPSIRRRGFERRMGSRHDDLFGRTCV